MAYFENENNKIHTKVQLVDQVDVFSPETGRDHFDTEKSSKIGVPHRHELQFIFLAL